MAARLYLFLPFIRQLIPLRRWILQEPPMYADTHFRSHILNRGCSFTVALPESQDYIGGTRLENISGKIHSGHGRYASSLTHYTRHLLSRPDALASPDTPEKLYDVIALALNPRAKNDHRHGLLALIRNHIDTHYADPDLDPPKAAATFDISVRYLHLLFAASDTTFTEYLIEQRLTQARLMLADPLFRHQTVLNIALGCGFRDINQFGRRFRVCYGVTPGEFRRASFAKLKGAYLD